MKRCGAILWHALCRRSAPVLNATGPTPSSDTHLSQFGVLYWNPEIVAQVYRMFYCCDIMLCRLH
jgi:hypothetical protein